MKVFTRPVGHSDGIWEVIVWSPDGHIAIPAHNQKLAGIFADLLVALIGGFGPAEVNRVH